ncbi:unnamed protein product [Bemisia tabaci]|uniref:Odorant-binding protein 8 n=1 Tax=Bemisia tabaci TaxID=7038 RepID=A0A125RYU8_BEMTA|nr:odorant-binding protein 8 [Bemisia tabaci]WJJ79932.1 OBP8 [Bemisia tabaci]CAH0768476.1 unnamed protein product [Bemisia tabaci]
MNNLMVFSILLYLQYLLAVKADQGNQGHQGQQGNQSEDQEKVKAIYQKCQQESMAEEKDLDNFKKMEMPSSEKGKCMMACLMREAKIIVNKRFSKDGAMALAQRYYSTQPQNMDKAKQVIVACDKQVEHERNECNIAGKLAECVVTEAQRVGLTSVPKG